MPSHYFEPLKIPMLINKKLPLCTRELHYKFLHWFHFYLPHVSIRTHLHQDIIRIQHWELPLALHCIILALKM